MRVVSAIVGGVLFAVLVVGLAIYPMLHPTFTRLLSQRYSLVADSGLSRGRVTQLAEQVREFVADSDTSALPATVDGRPGFDQQAVSHLVDVRHVLAGARTATGVLAALTVVFVSLAIARRNTRELGNAMIVSAGVCLLLVVAGALAGTMNFDSFFAWFHGLFFSAGTWEFPADSLLIQIFPEGFWMAAGATWAGLVVLGGAVLGVCGWLLRGPRTHANGTLADVGSSKHA